MAFSPARSTVWICTREGSEDGGMTTLTVWKFDSEGGARGALQVLERLQKEELLQVVDAAIVTWPPDRKRPKTEQLRSLGGAGALGGAFWGLLFRTALLHPTARNGDRRGNGRACRLDDRHWH
jgi:hypothetical protein